MADIHQATPGSDTARSRSVATAVLLDMADTTWRMFVPIVGLLLIGRYADTQLASKPWLMLGGAAIGSIIAMLLIKSQLQRGGAK